MTKALIRGCRVVGISAAAPQTVHGAADLATDISGPVERLIKATGIESRRRAPPGLTAADMCHAAATDLLQELAWDPASVDVLLFISQTPDYRLPASAAVLQYRLGLKETCAAFDVGLGCSGFVYGLWNAAALIRTGGAKRALILVGDTISQHIDPADRSVSGLFGDAGTATALELAQEDDFLGCVLGTDGAGWEHLVIRAGGARLQSGAGSDRLSMNGGEIFRFTMERVPPSIEQALALAGWRAEDVDLGLFHQANKMLLEQLARRCQIPAERMPIGLAEFGNSSGASVPLLCVSHLRERLRAGTSRVLIGGFGVGLSYGAVATVLQDLAIPPLRMLEAPRV